MASRTADTINLPRTNRQSLPVDTIPQVNIPQINGGAQRLAAMGAITHDAANIVGAIDQKNQEMAAEKQFGNIFLEAQREIKDFHAQATGDEDISGQTLAIYDKYISGLDSRGLPALQTEIVRKRLASQQVAIGQQALDYELKLKAKKYDENLSASIDTAANIVATDPRMFKDQLGGIEALITGSRLNEAEKAAKLGNARQLMGRVYLSRLAELNPAKARAEANSEAMNSIIDPQFKTSLLGKLDADFKAKASLALNDDIKSIEQARRLGVMVPQEFIYKTAQAVRASGNERAAAGLEKYAAVQDYTVGFSQKSLADQQLELRELHTQASLGDLHVLDKLEAASGALDEKIKGIKADPWGYYAQKGVIEPQEDSLIDAKEATPALLAQRRLAQEKVNQLEGGQIRLPLLTGGEIAQLSAMKDSTDPKKLAGVLTGLGAGMNGAERRATIAAVAAKEPLLAVAMGQDADKATRLLAGRTAKGEVSKEKVRALAAEKLKGVTIDGAVNETFQDAIYSYYKQLALEKGDASKEAQSDMLEQSIRDTVGDIVEINIGKPSRVIAPIGMTAAQLEDKLGSLTDEMLLQQGPLPKTSDGFRATAQDVMNSGRFMSSGDGQYIVQFPTGILSRDDGKKYTIDISQIEATGSNRAKNIRQLSRSRTGAINASQ